MRPDQVKIIAQRLGVTETDVIYVNRRLGRRCLAQHAHPR